MEIYLIIFLLIIVLAYFILIKPMKYRSVLPKKALITAEDTTIDDSDEDSQELDSTKKATSN